MVHLTSVQVDAVCSIHAIWPGTPVVLVGAVALGHYVAMRVSDDMDLAIAVELDEFPGGLATHSDWQRDPKVEHRFYFRDELPVDVLPIYGTALAQGFIDWPSGARMSVVGFDLAFVHFNDAPIAVGVTIRVPTAPVLALLKMRAWLDRPYEREKDLGDLAQLLVDYVGLEDDRRWAEDIVALEVDYEDVSPYLLGRELGSILDVHHQPHVAEFFASVSAEKLAAFGPASVHDAERAEGVLVMFKWGLAAVR